MDNSLSSLSTHSGVSGTKSRRTYLHFFILVIGGLVQVRHLKAFSCNYSKSHIRRPVRHDKNRIKSSTSVLHSTRINSNDHPRTWNIERKEDRNGLDDRSWSRQKMKPMPITGYDANKIEEYYDRRPLQVGWRLNSLGFPLLGMPSFLLSIAVDFPRKWYLQSLNFSQHLFDVLLFQAGILVCYMISPQD